MSTSKLAYQNLIQSYPAHHRFLMVCLLSIQCSEHHFAVGVVLQITADVPSVCNQKALVSSRADALERVINHLYEILLVQWIMLKKLVSQENSLAHRPHSFNC